MEELRTLGRGDLGPASALVEDAFERQHPRWTSPTQAPPPQWSLAETWAVGPADSCVLERDGRLIGVGGLRVLGTVGVIGPIAVRPEHQGRGHARRLTRACLAQARERGCSTIGLETYAQSPRHFALYADAGFRTVGLMVHLARDLGEAPEERTVRHIPGARVRPWSEMAPGPGRGTLKAITRVCEAYLPGYDPSTEMEQVVGRDRGELLILTIRDEVAGFALCCGGPSAVQPGQGLWVRTLGITPDICAVERAERLLRSAEILGRTLREPRIVIAADGRNQPLIEALLDGGYRPEAMQARMVVGPYVDRIVGVLCDDWR